MKYLIFIILGLVIIHFIYESILLPTIRLHLRFKLYALRDKLRSLKFENPETISDELFSYMQSSLNGTIKVLPFVSVSMIIEAKGYFENNKDIYLDAIRRRRMIEKCAITDVKEIADEHTDIILATLGANHLAWVIYIVPLAAMVLFFKAIKNLVKNLVFVPEGGIESVVPQHDLAIL